MFDVILNFEGIFRYLFSRNKKHNNMDFINNLKPHDKKTRISMILQKISNGHHYLTMLYRHYDNNKFELIDYFGDYNLTKITYFNSITIPIFENNDKLIYSIVICRNSKNKFKFNEELIEVLKNNL